MHDLIKTVVLFIIGFILLFALCREFVCWYFKINAIETLLQDIKELLIKQNNTDKPITEKYLKNKEEEEEEEESPLQKRLDQLNDKY